MSFRKITHLLKAIMLFAVKSNLELIRCFKKQKEEILELVE